MVSQWYCPNCHTSLATSPATLRVGTPWHNCPQLQGLTAPLVPEGTRAEVRAVEREDYVGSELVQTDGEGRPVMAVVTTRDDGQDCAVMAPTAGMGVGG